MNVAVITPWRPIGCPHRDAAWDYVRARWAETGWPIITGDDGGTPFARGASINLAAAQQPADVYVIADADTVTEHSQVLAAVAAAHSAPGLVLAYERYGYLSETGTRRVLAGFRGWWEPYLEWTLEGAVSSCVAVSAATWELAGGFPSSFRGWGAEDVAFEIACRVATGRPTRRVTGTCWHLWHPTEPVRPPENFERLHRLLVTQDDPEAFAAVKAELW